MEVTENFKHNPKIYIKEQNIPIVYCLYFPPIQKNNEISSKNISYWVLVGLGLSDSFFSGTLQLEIQ